MRLLVGVLAFRVVGVITFRAKAVTLDDHRLPMMHQPIDHGGGQSVIDVEDPAPVTEGTIRGDHDRSGLVAGRDDLKQQVGTAFVDGQIAQLIQDHEVEAGQAFGDLPGLALGLFRGIGLLSRSSLLSAARASRRSRRRRRREPSSA